MYRDRAVDAYKGVKVAWVCSPPTHGRFKSAFVVLKGAGFAPGTPGKRSVGTRRAASMQDTLSEGIARAAQLAPSTVTYRQRSQRICHQKCGCRSGERRPTLSFITRAEGPQVKVDRHAAATTSKAARTWGPLRFTPLSNST